MEWKLVSEREFQKNKRLLLCDDGYFFVGEFSHEENGIDYFFLCDGISSASHWMQLPDQPERLSEKPVKTDAIV